MRVVLDTNVVISAFIKADSNPGRILRLVVENKIQLCHNPAILFEYEGVMGRSKFARHIDQSKIKRFIGFLHTTGFSHTPVPSSVPLPDEPDRVFFDTAQETSAWLVTGNIRHYPPRKFIKTPAQFLDLLARGKMR
ncbi:MAG: putative toxin-antitoxin system toxin component, PIN family [Spirochaetia bacterium]|jgi:putative PIN family toxin of toxin-antitoxin system|nr:putative toxin-antitoxin system toxin component, PIN family [Spirochaetia bacterium]